MAPPSRSPPGRRKSFSASHLQRLSPPIRPAVRHGRDISRSRGQKSRCVNLAGPPPLRRTHPANARLPPVACGPETPPPRVLFTLPWPPFGFSRTICCGYPITWYVAHPSTLTSHGQNVVSMFPYRTRLSHFNSSFFQHTSDTTRVNMLIQFNTVHNNVVPQMPTDHRTRTK